MGKLVNSFKETLNDFINKNVDAEVAKLATQPDDTHGEALNKIKEVNFEKLKPEIESGFNEAWNDILITPKEYKLENVKDIEAVKQEAKACYFKAAQKMIEHHTSLDTAHLLALDLDELPGYNFNKKLFLEIWETSRTNKEEAIKKFMLEPQMVDELASKTEDQALDLWNHIVNEDGFGAIELTNLTQFKHKFSEKAEQLFDAVKPTFKLIIEKVVAAASIIVKQFIDKKIDEYAPNLNDEIEAAIEAGANNLIDTAAGTAIDAANNYLSDSTDCCSVVGETA